MASTHSCGSKSGCLQNVPIINLLDLHRVSFLVDLESMALLDWHAPDGGRVSRKHENMTECRYHDPKNLFLLTTCSS